MRVPKPWLRCICVLILGRLTLASQSFLHQAWKDESPSCEELRSFWEVVRRTVQLSQMTNEIPVLPLHLLAPFDKQHQWKTERKGHLAFNRKNMQTMYDLEHLQPFTSPIVQPQQSVMVSEPFEFFSPPENPNFSDNNAMDGFHDQFLPSFDDHPSIPAASSWQVKPEVTKFGPPSTFSEAKNSEEAYVPKWGSPEEAGMFGQFLDLDAMSPSHDTMTRIPKEAKGKWAAFPTYDTRDTKMTCSEMANKECAVDLQCECVGWPTFRCTRGRCTNRNLSHDYVKHYGTWHDGPLPKSKLGLFARLRKRNSRSIFM